MPARPGDRVLDLYRTLQAGARSDPSEWHWWDRLLGRIEGEWELIAGKAESAGAGLRWSGSDRETFHEE